MGHLDVGVIRKCGEDGVVMVYQEEMVESTLGMVGSKKNMTDFHHNYLRIGLILIDLLLSVCLVPWAPLEG